MKAFKYVICREGKYYVSQCLNIDIASCGDTIEEALSNLKDAVELYFRNEPKKETFRCA
jgi:predicted RNase H-like HicB family nuclease